MPRLLAGVKVTDFAEGKPTFDQLSDARKKIWYEGIASTDWLAKIN